MARFRVYASMDGDTLLLDVQANLLGHLNTCVVVPLLPLDRAPKPARVLNPVFDVDGVAHLMVTQFLATVPRRAMGKEVLDLAKDASVIVNALDCLFQGV